MIAVDVDLRKITAASDESSNVFFDRTDVAPEIFARVAGPGPILCEIAGPVMHSADGRDACPPGKRRWMLYNASWIGQLSAFRPGSVLVATSTAWTKGYKEAQRHAIAGMIPLKHKKDGTPVYKYAHDAREVFCMLHFYRLDPTVWVPLHTYLETL